MKRVGSPTGPALHEGKPFRLNGPIRHVSLLFGAKQSDKIRAFGDLRFSKTNLSFVVATPIKLPSRGHLVEISNIGYAGRRDWPFPKSDHEASYRKISLDPLHAKLSAISMRPPTDDRWYGLFSRTMVFGAVAAVLHYNVFSRMVAELHTNLFGAPASMLLF